MLRGASSPNSGAAVEQPWGASRAVVQLVQRSAGTDFGVQNAACRPPKSMWWMYAGDGGSAITTVEYGTRYTNECWSRTARSISPGCGVALLHNRGTCQILSLIVGLSVCGRMAKFIHHGAPRLAGGFTHWRLARLIILRLAGAPPGSCSVGAFCNYAIPATPNAHNLPFVYQTSSPAAFVSWKDGRLAEKPALEPACKSATWLHMTASIIKLRATKTVHIPTYTYTANI
jgi:hypothetical protein